MGVSNVNTANKAQIIKFALNKKSAQNTQAYKPEYLKMTGSIFNAKNSNGTKSTGSEERTNLTELNTRHSLGELKAPVSGGKKKIGEDSFQGIDDVASGKAAISTGRAATRDVEEYTAETEKNTDVVKKLSKGAENLGNQIKDNDKVFTSKLKADQKEFEKDNEKIKRLIKESEESEKVIDDAQHELEGLLARNSFQIGGTNGNDGTNNYSGRILELQTIIGSKVCLMQQNGKAIYSLQRNQNKTLSRMNRTNKMYINNQRANQKNIQSQEKQTNSVIDVAQKIEEYSALAEAGGQALNLAGDALIALGQGLCASIFGSTVGSAMIAVGGVMKKVGTVLELVGQYGQAAANLTKTAAYAAEGNLMGAMQSCAAAMQSGAAAVKSTGNIGKEWKNIDAQVNAGKQNIAAKEAAKNAVDNSIQDKALQNVGLSAEDIKKLSPEERAAKLKNISSKDMKAAQDEFLGGMSKKEAIKSTRNNLRNQMANNDNLTKFSDMKQFAKDNVGANLDKSVTEFKNNKFNQIDKMKLTKIGDKYYKTVTKKDGTTKQVAVNIDKVAHKTFDIPKLNDKAKVNINWGNNLQKLGSSTMTIATVFMRNQAMNEMSNPPKKRLEPYQMDARTRRIMQRNQKYRNHASYV